MTILAHNLALILLKTLITVCTTFLYILSQYLLGVIVYTIKDNLQRKLAISISKYVNIY
ncbi:hypothetical protein BDW59DRAFT_139841 [Aspergillus cavernicola]|uniref:Uncharacterized protein n=1 Tax=Aspergillus cavernicola TaxID=176166 RepID=A0ABR4IV99_9EURO